MATSSPEQPIASCRIGDMSNSPVIDRYFLEHRAKVLDVAAFLDRIDRAGEDAGDFRLAALRQCIEVLLEDEPGRAERALRVLSDPSSDPIERAGTKGATGACPPEN